MITYDEKVVVVTGGGAGSIGERHARTFASRGASVVVNDISPKAADATVNAILANNGRAIANYDSVLDGGKIVAQALDAYGRIDLMLNNAGNRGIGPEGPTLVGDVSATWWRETVDVHLTGTFECTKAALKPMVEQGSGSILVTSSPTGIFGCTGASAYSAAKMALIGFMQSTAVEYHSLGVRCNALVPVADGGGTRATLSAAWNDAASAEYVSEFAAWLAHESCSISGRAFEVGGGYIHPLRVQMGAGIQFDEHAYSAETIAEHSGLLNDFSDSFYPDIGELTVILNKIADRAGEPPMETVRFSSETGEPV